MSMPIIQSSSVPASTRVPCQFKMVRSKKVPQQSSTQQGLSDSDTEMPQASDNSTTPPTQEQQQEEQTLPEPEPEEVPHNHSKGQRRNESALRRRTSPIILLLRSSSRRSPISSGIILLSTTKKIVGGASHSTRWSCGRSLPSGLRGARTSRCVNSSTPRGRTMAR